MLNLLKSDLYRLVRRSDFWAFVAFIVVTVGACAALLAWVTSPEFAVMVNEQAVDAGPSGAEQAEVQADLDEDLAEVAPLNDKVMDSLTATWAQTFVTGGMLGVLGSMLASLFLVSDMEHGFVKNLLMSRRGRRIYYGEKLVFVALLQAMLLAVFAVAATVAFAAAGFSYEVAEGPTEVALWLGLAWLLAVAYALIAAVVTWLTRSKWLGVVLALVVSTGVAGMVVAQLCSLLALGLPWLAGVPQWLLHECARLLGGGSSALLLASDAALAPLGIPVAGHVLLVEALWVGAGVAVALGVCRKRDV